MDLHAHLDLMGVVWRLGAIMLLVFINGFFVATEFALVKARPVRIDELARKGSRRARIASHLLSRLDYYLSACQLGVTMASLVLGAIGEPAVARLLVGGASLIGLELDPTQPVIRAVALVLAFLTITILHMTVGEQAPKMMALQRSEAAAMASSIPLRVFAWVFTPLIWLINAISNGLLRWIGLHAVHGEETVLTTTELRQAIALSAKAGHIPERGQKIADNVLRMVNLEVRHILVPRTEVSYLSLQEPLQANIDLIHKSRHTRFPLCDGSLDAVVGIVHSKDVLKGLLDEAAIDLTSLARQSPIVPERLPLHAFTGRLQRQGDHAAIVIDGHGSVTGMAFLEDAIEKVIGPIADEFHEPRKDFIELGPGSVEVAGATPLPDLEELLDLDFEDSRATTIGGQVMALLGRLPEVGDHVELDGHRATVTALTDRGVPARIRIERRKSPPPDSNDAAR